MTIFPITTILFQLIIHNSFSIENKAALKIAVRTNSPFGVNGTANFVSKRVQCLFDSINEPISIIELPWKRAQSEAKSGKIAGFFLGSKNKERLTHFFPVGPINISQWFLLHKKSIKITENQVKKYTVGAIRGTNNLKWALESKYNVAIMVNNESALLKSLELDRASLGLMSNKVLISALSKKIKRTKANTYNKLSNEKKIIFLNQEIKEELKKWSKIPVRDIEHYLFLSKVMLMARQDIQKSIEINVEKCFKKFNFEMK